MCDFCDDDINELDDDDYEGTEDGEEEYEVNNDCEEDEGYDEESDVNDPEPIAPDPNPIDKDFHIEPFKVPKMNSFVMPGGGGETEPSPLVHYHHLPFPGEPGGEPISPTFDEITTRPRDPDLDFPHYNTGTRRFSFGGSHEEQQDEAQVNEDADSESNTEQASENDHETSKTKGSDRIGFGKTVGGWGWTYARCDHTGCKCEKYHGEREGGHNCTECGHPFEEHH